MLSQICNKIYTIILLQHFQEKKEDKNKVFIKKSSQL